MRPVRVIGLIGSLAVTTPIALTMGAHQAAAHGALEDPISRSYVCYLEGPENPTSDVCKAVVGAGGTQPLYDWMEVNIADAAGRHRDIIPDGQLCSAGRAKYAGLDLPRGDWPATTLPSDSDYTFRYRATAPHTGGFEFYITKDGYDPMRPLAWDDLEPEPFLTVADPNLVDGFYVMPGHLPEKSGRHVIYAIWQRTDSPEAFYACSDVEFEQDGGSRAGSGTGGSDDEPATGGSDDESARGGDGECLAGNEKAAVTPADSSLASGHEHADAGELAATGGANSTRSALLLAAAVMALAATMAMMRTRRPGRPGTHRRFPAHRRT